MNCLAHRRQNKNKYTPGLHLVEVIDLFAHLSHGIVVLLAKTGEGSLVLDALLLQVATELRQLGLALLVEFNLGSGGTSGFIQTLTELLELTAQVGLSFLGLGTGLALVLKLFLEFFDAGLLLLDLLLDLGNKALFVLELGGQGGDLLVLALNGLLEFLLVAFEISDGLLGEFEVALNLPLGLFDLGLEFLLAFERVLELIECLLKLRLDLVEVVALVLNGLKVFGSLLVALLKVLLLLVDLVDKFVLVGDLIVKVANLMVLGCLVLLRLLHVEFKIFNVLLKTTDFLVKLLLALEDLVTCFFLLGKALSDFLMDKEKKTRIRNPPKQAIIANRYETQTR